MRIEIFLSETSSGTTKLSATMTEGLTKIRHCFPVNEAPVRLSTLSDDDKSSILKEIVALLVNGDPRDHSGLELTFKHWD